MKGWMSVVLAVFLVAVCGCQCSPLFEGYAAFVDDHGDQVGVLEPLYSPQLDISRMGRPDWCRSPWNRLLVPCECDQSRE